MIEFVKPDPMIQLLGVINRKNMRTVCLKISVESDLASLFTLRDDAYKRPKRRATKQTCILTSWCYEIEKNLQQVFFSTSGRNGLIKNVKFTEKRQNLLFRCSIVPIYDIKLISDDKSTKLNKLDF